MESDHWVVTNITVDKGKVVKCLPRSIPQFFNFFIIIKIRSKAVTHCDRSVVKPSKTRAVMIVIWWRCGRDRVPIKTKIRLKSSLTYFSLPVTEVLSIKRKTKKRLLFSVDCFECVTAAGIKIHWQTADSSQPTRFDDRNLIGVLGVSITSKYHHLSVDPGRATVKRASFLFKWEMINIGEVSWKTKIKKFELFCQNLPKKSNITGSFSSSLSRPSLWLCSLYTTKIVTFSS